MTNRENPVKLRTEVAWFAQQMELKLRENDHKGDWIAFGCDYLQRRMRAESVELEQAIVDAGSPPWGQDEPHRVAIIREAADVANFAMMLADNWRGGEIDTAFEALGEQQPQPVTPTQPRDESRDVFVYEGGGTLEVTEYSHYLEHQDDWNVDGERYVPYAQLEAYRHDSELLDAILEARKMCDIQVLYSAIRKAEAERAKR